MKRYSIICFFVFLVLFSWMNLESAAVRTRSQAPIVHHSDQILLRTCDEESARSLAADNGLRIVCSFPNIAKVMGGWYGVFGKNERDTRSIELIVDAITRDERVVYAQYDYEYQIYKTPNDTDYSKQWGMPKISAPTAWDVSTGSQQVVVGVVDTGINYNHPDLAANVWTNTAEIAGNGIDDDNNGYIDDVHGFNALTNTGDPLDDNKHGSHCSGIIGAVGNNSAGVVGVSWNVKIMGLKFLSAEGSGDTLGAIKCLDYAIEQKLKGVNIVALSNSYGGGGFEQIFYDAISAVNETGMVFVCAAGNDSADNDVNPHYPSNYELPNIIAVASSTSSDGMSSFSDWGLVSVDLAAPGSGIYSTTLNSAYESLDGTSMACPHVSGAVGLMAAAFPNETVHQRVARILNNVDAVSAFSGKIKTGGRLNLYKAITAKSVIDANFVAASNPNNYLVNFTDKSSSSVAITQWLWNFAGLQTSSLQNPSYTFATEGDYTVSLTVTDAESKTDTVSKKVAAGNQAPKAGFFYTISGMSVAFADKSTDPDGTVCSLIWNFGDGATSTEKKPSHTYTEKKTYAVTLIAIDPMSKIGTKSVKINLTAYCQQSGGSTSYEYIESVKFGAFENISHDDGGEGDYTDLVITGSLGQTYTIALTPGFPSSASTEYFKVWIDYNQDGDWADTGEEVFSGSGTTTVTGSVTIPSSALSGYTRLRVAMNFSSSLKLCEDGYFGEVEDYSFFIAGQPDPAPTAKFTAYQRSDSYKVSFVDLSYDNRFIESWSWDFNNDGSADSTMQFPIYSFSGAGAFPVRLEVTDSNGLKNSSSQSFAVKPINGTVTKEDLAGSWTGLGTWIRNSDTGAWTKITPEIAKQLVAADFNGNGKDDILVWFTFGIWIYYDTGSWEKVLDATDLVWLSTGDTNGDGKADVVGSWTFGVWKRDTASGAWTRLHPTSAYQVDCGDFDNDGKADLLGVWDVGIWVNYASGAWQKILDKDNLVQIAAGDLSGDGRCDVFGSWTIGVWLDNLVISTWSQLHTQPASQIGKGNLDGAGGEDLIGLWSAIPGLWVRYSTGTWAKLHDTAPVCFSAGKFR